MANPPAAVTISGNRAYIATTVNYPYGSVEVIDTNNYNMISSIPVDRDSWGIAALENYIFVANQASGTISIINVTTNTVVSTLAVGNNPTGVAVDPLTNKVYVTNQGDKNISIIGLVSNNPPNTPTNPSPVNDATNKPTNPSLSWSGGDLDGDTVTYTVYLDTSSNPTTQKCSGTSASCVVSGLSYSTQYYWKVVASDGKASPVSGTIWSFTTQAQPDFAISITPPSQSIVQGALTSYSISLISENGFNSAVSLSASVLPSGVTASFNPVSVTPTGSSTLTIQTSDSTPVGSYPLTINGTGGGKIHEATVTLSVTAVCGLTGDLNCDGIVDMAEIFIAIDKFASGTVDMDYIFAAIDAFAATA
ncbi:PE-PGRS family protein PE_PGRS18 [Methanosarcinales archaeon]|nr:PE-PGRS family protein PE_PGRS18 [Methanosarcinales archaeon]